MKDGRIYDLNPLLQRDFNFVFDAATGVESVAIKKLRLASKAKKGDRITLEADVTRSATAIYDLLDQIAASVPLYMYNVTQVELVVAMNLDSDSPPKNVRVSITYPNSCSLKYDDVDLRIRDMLHLSGIEPQERTEPGESSSSS